VINPIWQLFGFSGRMGRQAYWLGLILVGALSPVSLWTIVSPDPFREVIATLPTLGWAGVAWTLALFLPLAALNTKRLHDLGQSGWQAVLFYAPAAIGTLELFVGQAPIFAEFQWWAGWALWLAGATGAWFLVRLGFYGGTDGSNRYGARRGSGQAHFEEASP